MSALTVLNPHDLRIIEGEQQPRVQDLKLAQALGFADPTDIRELIARPKNRSRLERRAKINSRTARENGARGPAATEYWLTEWQAIKVCMWSEAPNADEVQDLIVDVFLAWRHGELVPRSEASPTTILDDLFAVARDTRNVVAEVHQNVVYLKQHAERIEEPIERIDRNVADLPPKRIKIPPEHIRAYQFNIETNYRGECPTGCGTLIVRDGIRIDDASEADHWKRPDCVGLHECWLVCNLCNSRLRDEDFKAEKEEYFRAFHVNLRLIIDKQLRQAQRTIIPDISPNAVPRYQHWKDAETDLLGFPTSKIKKLKKKD